MKTLILYYSYGGNTKRIAELMQKEIGADLAEIQPVEPYSLDFDSVVEQAKKEIDTHFMPAIQPLTVNIAAYDRILIGSPVWWYTFVPVIQTFLHQNDLSGKTVSLFATNEGWIGHTFSDFAKASKKAIVKEGINILFSNHSLKTSEAEIMNWLHNR